ncbi:MAG: hypothetical protein WAS21_16310, partial [Geminicoccaceae bacterium]
MTQAFRPCLVQATAPTSLAMELERLHALLAAERRRGETAADAPQVPLLRWEPLAAFAERLGLGEFETDLVLLLFAPEIEPGFAELYGLLRDDPHLRWPTLALAQRLFGGDPAQGRAVLLPSAPLARLRCIVVEAGDGLPVPLRPLRLDDAVVAWLLRQSDHDLALAAMLKPLAGAPLPAEDAPLADRLAADVAERTGLP